MFCLWSDQSEVVDVFCTLSLVVKFKVFYSHFPVTAFGLDLFSGAYLTVSAVPDV